MSGRPTIAALLLLALAAPAAAGDPQAKNADGKLPAVAARALTWQRLLVELIEEGASFGAVAAARRMIRLFPDVVTQEAGYRALIALADAGYPGEINPLFLTADLEPVRPPRDPNAPVGPNGTSGAVEDSFVEDYYFYKMLINRAGGFARWAEYYSIKADPASNERYRLLQAIEAYQKKDVAQAREIVQGLLAKPRPGRATSFNKRLARMLARFAFEEKRFAESLEIYDTYLLKHEWVTPSDWLEAAWNLFYLKRHSEALGYLYNLEAPSGERPILLEKYMLRGLIFHALCDRKRIDELLNGFETLFAPVLSAVKNGEDLGKIGVLAQISPTRGSRFQVAGLMLDELARERRRTRLSDAARALAQHLYDSEIDLLELQRDAARNGAIEDSAEQVIMTFESLRFLGFEIIRSKFDPDRVFGAARAGPEAFDGPPAAPLAPGARPPLTLRWLQPGDYWRDERLLYRAEARSKCPR